MALWNGCNSSFGPRFEGAGGGCCLNLCASDNPATSYAKPNAGYPDTTGLGDALFTGAHQFTTEDYEVWAAT
jgi:hypothetical protein